MFPVVFQPCPRAAVFAGSRSAPHPAARSSAAPWTRLRTVLSSLFTRCSPALEIVPGVEAWRHDDHHRARERVGREAAEAVAPGVQIVGCVPARPLDRDENG